MILSNFVISDFKETWHIIIQLLIICALFLLSNTIRRKVPFFRKMLLPTAIIGGFIGLGLKYLIRWLDLNIDGTPIMTNEFLEMITYHTIALGFIALSLKTVSKAAKKSQKNKDGRAIKSGLMIVTTYLIQGIAGLTITIVLGFFLKEVAQYGGILLPMGYGQGPGQAGNIGGNLETAGFVGGKAFGLSIAAFGFLWACIPGVIYLNRLAKKGKVRMAGEEVIEQAVLSEEVESAGEIPLSEAVDKLTIQICLVGLVYLITWLFMFLVTRWLPTEGFLKTLGDLIWGFNFIFAMLFAMLVKKILNLLQKKKLMKRQYTNNYMLNRITGVAFDFMIICSIMAIEVEQLSWQLWLALILVSTIGGLVTLCYCKYACKKVYPDYEHEAMASMYGMLTGTASTGVALLREIDPQFKTPAADNLVIGSSTAVIFGFPLLLITGVIAESAMWMYLSLGMIVVFFIVFAYFLLFFKRKPKKENKLNKTENE